MEGVRPGLSITRRLAIGSCFGAIAAYVDGHIFASCGKFGVALRLPPETLSQLFKEADVSRLRYFPGGHVKRDYAVIPERILEDRARLGKLLDQSIAHAPNRRSPSPPTDATTVPRAK